MGYRPDGLTLAGQHIMGGSNFATLGAIPDASNDGVLSAPINLATTGVAIAAVAGKRIFVHGMFLTIATAGTVQFQDINAGTSTTNLTGAMTLASGVPLDLPWQQYPYMTCAAGDNLTITCASQVSGRIFYTQG